MKIIHIVPHYPPHIGGMENITKKECDYQASLGHEVIIFTSKIGIDNKNLKECINRCNPKIYYLRTITGKTEFPMFFPSLILNLLKCVDKKTMVHIHCAIAFDGDIVPIISKIIGFKTIMHIHQEPKHKVPIKSLLLDIYKHSVWRISLLLADKILCPTNVYVEKITRYGVRKDKCAVIHNGIKLENNVCKFSNKSPNELLFVGRLSKEKNIFRLIDAFKIVQKKYISVNLHIVGSGECLQIIKEKIKNENIENITIHGAIPHDEISEIYKNCDIFISTSDDESFGNVLLEAMNFGLPIVATDIPAYREVLGSSGVLSRPTPEDFAKNIIHLIDDKEYRTEIVLQEKERINEFDIKNTMYKLMNLYYKIINK